MQLPTLAIVGRPNVGKSTLFNRLIGKKKALVYDQPGVTRDRHYAQTDWAGLPFQVIDTGGFEMEPESDLFAQMRRQVETALREADLVLWVVDSRQGLLPDDEEMAERLRKTGKPVFLVVNKIDHAKQEQNLADFFRLGMEKVFPVSAEHGRGIADLLDETVGILSKEKGAAALPVSHPIRLAILGRPNVGKSTLLNRLFGAPRAVVHPEPGTTRDPLDVEIEEEGRLFKIVDTAGIRKKSHAEGKIEKVSVLKAFEAVEKSDVILLLIDATVGVTSQDGKVAGEALRRNRPLILLVNKWDAVEGKTSWEKMREAIERKLATLQFLPVFPISAKTGRGVSRIFKEAMKVYGEYNKRIATGELNRVFQRVTEAHPPPTVSGKSIHLFYMTQISTRPPTFVIFTNHPEILPETYKRYLVRELRQAFSFRGTPIRLEFRARKKKPFHASKD